MKKFSIISIIIILSLSYNIYGNFATNLKTTKVKDANNKRRKTMLSQTSKEDKQKEVRMKKELSPIYDFEMLSIDQEKVSLKKYKNKLMLIVNVASKCGYTYQYKGLQALYTKYKDKGLVILGFPANNFLWQEPGSDSKIKAFCTSKYGVDFPMFSKISVKGRKAHPLYKFLTSKKSNPGFDGRIGWNFTKFLTNRNGKVIARFSPKTKPFDPKIIEAIESALKNK